MKSLEALSLHQKSTLLPTDDVLSAGQSGTRSGNDLLLSSDVSSATPNAKSSAEQLQRFRFRTRYNLNVEVIVELGQIIDVSINLEREESSYEAHTSLEHANLTQAKDERDQEPVLEPSPVEQAQKFRYRIVPDWQTSYFWYDSTWPGNPDEEYMVEEEDIEQRYPSLFPCLMEWVETYETEYDRKFGPHADGPSAGPALTPSQTVAWQISGFFMCCWLALQHDVDSVEYRGWEKYEIRSESMEAEFKRLLYDKEAKLQSGREQLLA